MTVEQILEASRALPISERLDLAQAIWDEASHPQMASEYVLTSEQKVELQRRIQNMKDHPEQSVRWDEMKSRIAAMRAKL